MQWWWSIPFDANELNNYFEFDEGLNIILKNDFGDDFAVLSGNPLYTNQVQRNHIALVKETNPEKISDYEDFLNDGKWIPMYGSDAYNNISYHPIHKIVVETHDNREGEGTIDTFYYFKHEYTYEELPVMKFLESVDKLNFKEKNKFAYI